MGDVLAMAAMILLIPIGIVVILVLLFASKANSNAAASSIERAEHVAREEAYAANREVLRSFEFEGWAISEKVKIDGEMGLIGMRADGGQLKLLKTRREGVDLFPEGEETILLRDVCSVNISREIRSKTVTHKTSTPVAVRAGRSAGKRALVGAAIAGPAGAIIGGASGMGGKSTIEHVEGKYHETVQYRTHPKLIVQVRDVVRPRRVLEFDTVAATNDWSSRIWQAMPNH